MNETTADDDSAPPLPRDEQPSALRGALAGAWAGLLQALDGGKLYELDHPLVRDACREAAERLHAASDRWPLTLLVEPEELLPIVSLARAEGDRVGPAEARLARTLHGLDIGAMRFGQPPTAEDLVALAGAVAAVRPGVAWGDGLGRLEAATGGRIGLEPLDFTALVGGGGRAETESGVDWASLVRCLTRVPAATSDRAPAAAGEPASPEGAPEPAAPTAETAAAAIARRMVEDPQLGEHMLRQRLREAGGVLDSLDGEQAAAGRENLQRFGRELGRLLGEPGPETAGPASNPGGSLFRHTLLMCRTLSQFEAEGAEGDAGQWTESVGDLLEQKLDGNHTPAAYLQRLEALAARQDAGRRERSGAGSGSAVGATLSGAFDADAVRSHVAGVALALCEGGSATDPASRAALAGAVASMLGRGRCGLLLRVHALLGAPADENPDDDKDPLREAWESQLCTPEAGEAIAGWCGTDGAAGGAAVLLKACGPAALQGFLQAAGGGGGSATALRSLPAEVLAGLRGSWLAGSPAAAPALARALAPIPFEEASQLLGRELVQADPARRLAAFSALLEVSSDLGHAVLLGLLDDPDPRVRRLATQRILRVGGDLVQRLEALGSWIRQRPIRKLPTLDELFRAVAADPRGVGLLHHLLLTPVGEAPAEGRHRLALARALQSDPKLPAGLVAAAGAVKDAADTEALPLRLWRRFGPVRGEAA